MWKRSNLFRTSRFFAVGGLKSIFLQMPIVHAGVSFGKFDRQERGVDLGLAGIIGRLGCGYS
jgi:hypothetical protein